MPMGPVKCLSYRLSSGLSKALVPPLCLNIVCPVPGPPHPHPRNTTADESNEGAAPGLTGSYSPDVRRDPTSGKSILPALCPRGVP